MKTESATDLCFPQVIRLKYDHWLEFHWERLFSNAQELWKQNTLRPWKRPQACLLKSNLDC